jgi:hypothetical protein
VKETNAMSSKFRRVADVLDGVARTGRPDGARLDAVAAEFGGLDAFLLALHHRWWTAVYAHLDALLEDPPADFEAGVARLWADMAARQPGLRVLLDAHAARPALAAAERGQRERLRADLGVELPAAAVAPARPVRRGMIAWRRVA